MQNQKQIFEKIGLDMKNIIELIDYVQNHVQKIDHLEVRTNIEEQHIDKNLSWLKNLNKILSAEFSNYNECVDLLNKLTYRLNGLYNDDRKTKAHIQKNNKQKLVITPYGKLEKYPN